jgi:hypothetical protein
MEEDLLFALKDAGSPNCTLCEPSNLSFQGALDQRFRKALSPAYSSSLRLIQAYWDKALQNS